MKWLLEISDCPVNIEYPILGEQVMDNGIKRGPFPFKRDSIIKALSQESSLTFDADSLYAKELNSPLLPFGTIRYSHTDDYKRERLTMVLPKKKWDIRYRDEEQLYSIEFPKLIMQYALSKQGTNTKALIETRLFAIEDNHQPITEDTQLYAFPFPNVDKSNGIVCWGANEALTIQSLLELERVFIWFVSAPFNEDHGVRTSLGFSSFRKLIHHIQEKSFNDEWLVPLNKSLKDIFKK